MIPLPQLILGAVDSIIGTFTDRECSTSAFLGYYWFQPRQIGVVVSVVMIVFFLLSVVTCGGCSMTKAEC